MILLGRLGALGNLAASYLRNYRGLRAVHLIRSTAVPQHTNWPIIYLPVLHGFIVAYRRGCYSIIFGLRNIE